MLYHTEVTKLTTNFEQESVKISEHHQSEIELLKQEKENLNLSLKESENRQKELEDKQKELEVLLEEMKSDTKTTVDDTKLQEITEEKDKLSEVRGITTSGIC